MQHLRSSQRMMSVLSWKPLARTASAVPTMSGPWSEPVAQAATPDSRATVLLLSWGRCRSPGKARAANPTTVFRCQPGIVVIAPSPGLFRINSSWPEHSHISGHTPLASCSRATDKLSARLHSCALQGSAEPVNAYRVQGHCQHLMKFKLPAQTLEFPLRCSDI